ncbi:Oxidoreductase molybdopterin binding domain protein [Pelagimonas phthalicica]|uniref:Oxidoreductase molybdopterin binding domain protein n=1 Tax=Pelagimonas phthalicica TaxID=1037362 RepID=A0A238J9S7_9RHOB|nr:molybdopterin-dependent oxidoreductase [Pelagimonas phthalicica]TDS94056.1 hypothetical protein CLV87_0549 [Pelagimonas phthalicica]SMX27418.1 Oxidoreductase molybdopterin binding domain protein [Pelagimonas phthalicica]
MIRFLRSCFVFLVFFGGVQAQADEMPIPTGPVILQMSGEISRHNNEDLAEFDLEMLQALPRTELRTTTIWTDGMQEFVGVELGDLLDYIGANGTVIDAWAINDYYAEIPLTDAVPGSALIAYQRNGKPMSVRDKGPLWIIYPYDHSSDFRTEVYFSRSVWQLNRLEVLR